MAKNAENEQVIPGRLLSPAAVAEWLDVPIATLYQWRLYGSGPRASKVGRHLRYRVADVERWLDEQAIDPKSA